MPTAPELALDAAVFENNLIALCDAALNGAADLLRDAALPSDARMVQARDGRATVVWTDGAGRTRWLGGTTMPDIRADGLLERFDAGMGNVALIGMGQGSLVRALLDRLSPVQAVIVVSESAADAALVLRVHDFADAIRAGRLLLFVGQSAWEDLSAYLLDHDGYLASERLLNWPWFTPSDVSQATERLSRLSAALARFRADQRQALLHAHRSSLQPSAALPLRDHPAATDSRRPVRLAVYCPHGDGIAATCARSLARAATTLDPEASAALSDHPSRRHPIVAARSLAGLRPDWIVVVDAPREALPATTWAEARVAVWLTDSALVCEESIRRLSPRDRLIVPDEAGRQAALRLGVPADGVRRVPPGGDPQAVVTATPPFVNLDAAVAGLRFASQQAVWEAAKRIARTRVGVWRDEAAEELLQAAMRDTGVRFDIAEVRDGLLQRIRRVLGPGVERNTYLEIWNEALAAATAQPAEAARAIGRPAIFFPSGGRLERELLNAAAAGSILFVRNHPRQANTDGRASFLDPAGHVTVFSSPAELKRHCASYLYDPQAFIAKARAAQQHVAASESWQRRLATALDD